MDNKEEALIKILSSLQGKSLDEVADNIISLFKDPERWKPEPKEDYWYVDCDGRVEGERWSGLSAVDTDRWAFYNCFKTRQEAEQARDKIKEVLRTLHKKL